MSLVVYLRVDYTEREKYIEREVRKKINVV